MLHLSLAFTFLSVFLPTRVLAQGNWTTSPFNPFSLPLAVKNPYVNTWAPLGYDTIGSSPLNGAVPRLWGNVFALMGWDAAILVDGSPYQLLGVPPGNTTLVNAIQQSFIFTPTRSTFVLRAGPVDVTMTFMSPVEAKDLVHQSMPFSYLYFNVDSVDGNTHDVTIYTDVTGEWITGNTGLDATWQINESGDFVYLQMSLTSPAPYEEIDNRPQDATVYYCSKKANGVSWQIGPADDIRAGFANGVSLSNQAEAGTHPVGQPFNTLSFSAHVGNTGSTSEPIAFALGVVRDPVVRYTNGSVQIEERSAYYWSEFANIHDVIADVIGRAADALSTAVSLDNQILADAGQISSRYGDILSLVTRQAMGAYEYTLSKSNGLNTSDVKAFMKDMGEIGSGGVNAVDVLYSAMPVYLYFNPNILGHLLRPLLEQQEGPQYTTSYAAQDIGTRFPLATGNPVVHNQGIEHSANMVILCLAHAQATGDGSLLARHYSLLSQWASYLINNTMNPSDQTTSASDGIRSTNQTNLILKGIIGIGAMAKISEYGGRSDDKNRYEAVAKEYAQQWTSLASGPGQLNLNLGYGSSGLIYNLYADKLLQLNLIDDQVYSLQTPFYQQQISLRKYGIPLDGSNTSSISRTDWMMFAASSVPDTTVRDAMISQIWEYAASNIRQNQPLPVLYNAEDATSVAGVNSPAQGAMFAPLALKVPLQPVNFSLGTASSDGEGGSNGSGGGDGHKSAKSPNTQVIVGTAVGGLSGLGIAIGLLIFCTRRRRRESTHNDAGCLIPTKRKKDRPESFTEHPRSLMVTEAAHLRAVPYKCPPAGNSRGVSNPSSSAKNSYSTTVTIAHSEQDNLKAAMRRHFADKDDLLRSGAQNQPPHSQEHDPSLSGMERNEILSEMNHLRQEIARMREERVAFSEPLPSYDDGIATVRAAR